MVSLTQMHFTFALQSTGESVDKAKEVRYILDNTYDGLGWTGIGH
jgi:hypothetical protein